MSRVRPGLLLVAALLGVVLASCGSEPPPGEAAPAVAQRLDQVDAAVSDGDPAAVRRAVDALVRATDDAEAAGDVSADQADRIRAAADRLVAALPDDSPEPAVTEDPTPTPEPETDPGDEEAPGNSDHAEGHGHGHGPEGKGHGSED